MTIIVDRGKMTAHIKEHLEAFQALTGRKTVEEYFDEYWHKYPQGGIYYRLCHDLELTPVIGAARCE